MKAIHINPWSKTITEVQISKGDTYEALRSVVFAGKERGLLEACSLGAGHVAFLDEEGLLLDWDHQAFFGMVRQDGSVQTIAGHAVILRNDGYGGETDCTLPIEMIQATVLWIDREDVRTPAPTITTIGKDGDEVTEPLDGKTTEWTYNNQPG
jgi:hypothetical protein